MSSVQSQDGPACLAGSSGPTHPGRCCPDASRDTNGYCNISKAGKERRGNSMCFCGLVLLSNYHSLLVCPGGIILQFRLQPTNWQGERQARGPCAAETNLALAYRAPPWTKLRLHYDLPTSELHKKHRPSNLHISPDQLGCSLARYPWCRPDPREMHTVIIINSMPFCLAWRPS